MIIRKIFNGIFDEEVHSSFLKFSRGEYKNKYLLNGKKQGKNWAVKADSDYANFLVKKCLEKVSGPVVVKGIIVMTINLGDDELGFAVEKRSNFQGVRKLKIDSVIEPSRILNLMEKYPKIFFALSFKGADFVLKIKAKSPISGKPGKEKEGEPVADFCSLKTKDKNLLEELFFNIGDFNEVSVNYTINVTDIIYPADAKDLKPAEIRALAKKKGTIKRKVNADGIEKTRDASFVV